MAIDLCIRLISFFTLIILAQSRLYLDVSDHKALLTIQKDLGFTGQHSAPASPCNTTGVFCDRRISTSGYVLRISRIVFDSRQLTGFLSSAVGQLSELKELSLSNNYLFDRIPTKIADCRKLQVLNLKNNRFSGQVPPELSSLVHLRILDLDSNKFSGNLNFLRHFPNLEKLSLSNNMFTGKVPAALRSFRNLRSFNISGNSFLEGVVPELSQQSDYSSRSKRYIYAETSNATGTGTRVTSPFSSNIGEAPAPSPTSAPHRHKKKRNRVRGLILGFLVGAIAGFFSGFVFSLLFKLFTRVLQGSEDNSGIMIFSPIIKKRENLAFLENEDGLASLEVIGRGGCGEVYKAELPDSNGKWIAIKKVKQPPKEAAEIQEEESKLLNKIMRQIKSEIQTVGHIRHRNLLPLLAHLSRPDCHYLVYEYMKNGSLQDILAGVAKGERELDWLSRHRIAVGVASGLEYLHLNHTPRIIHRDLKPANILLDDEMEARIADFGLAKAVPDAQTHVSTTNVAGTVGYIAPEYHQTLKFTAKCDIYSFGVMLGVLVIGNLPSDNFFQHTEEMNLTKWMRNVMTSDDPKRAIDPKLLGNGYEEQMLLVLKIACFCTLDNPKERPNSKDVRCMLSQIVH